jgi:hypothetical protein
LRDRRHKHGVPPCLSPRQWRGLLIPSLTNTWRFLPSVSLITLSVRFARCKASSFRR